MVRERLTGLAPPANAKMMSISGVPGSRRRPRRASATWATPFTTRRNLRACRATSSPPSIWPMSLATIPINRTRPTSRTTPSPMPASARKRPTARSRKASSPPPRSCRTPKARPMPPKWSSSRRTWTRSPMTWKARSRMTARSRGGPQLPFSSLSNEDFYHVYTNQFDEEISAEDLCDTEELTRLRNYLDKQLVQSAGRRGAPRQPPAAPPHGAAEPLLGFRSRGRHPRCRAPARASSSIPCIRCPSRSSRTCNSATPW